MTYLRIKMRKDETVRLEVAPVNGVWHIRFKHEYTPLHVEADSESAIEWIRAQVRKGISFDTFRMP